MNDSVEALSRIIGNKKFLLGDEPCEDDAAVFGLLAQGLYSSPDAPFHAMFESNVKQIYWVEEKCQQFMISECPNLVAYIERIKTIYWQDWSDLLSK